MSMDRRAFVSRCHRTMHPQFRFIASVRQRPAVSRLVLQQHYSSHSTRVAATHKWFESIVIGEKLCPFASPLAHNSQLLRIVCSDAIDTPEVVEFIAGQVEELVGEDAEPKHETTLVVLDSPFVADFRDFVRLSWELQQEAIGDMYMKKLQLVLFHPLATHQTYGELGEVSPGDYSIRSPFPTVHLLREEDVMKAVQGGYPNLETLPARNKEKLTERGLEVCKRRLEDCYPT